MAKRKTKVAQRKAQAGNPVLNRALRVAASIVKRKLQEAEALLNLTGGKHAD